VAATKLLLPPVLDGLSEIAEGKLPRVPHRFSVSALILCEFMEMHAQFEETKLLPLGKLVMEPGDMARLGRDMAKRRGMEAPSSLYRGSLPRPRPAEIRTGGWFREVEPPGYTYSIVRVIRPRSGRLHAWLRRVDGPNRRSAHVLRSLEALRDSASFVRVPEMENKRRLWIVRPDDGRAD
jgi:hypothetical protein